MNVGIIGYRGLVGRILLNKLKKKKFLKITKIKNFKKKKKFQVILYCGNAENSNYFYLKCKKKFNPIWVDSSSFFRNNKNSTLLLDPINKKEIIKSLEKKKKIYSGCNCTVSIMLIALGGIIKNIKKIYCHTYQSISGAGYLETLKLINDYKKITKNFKKKISYIEKKIIKDKTICFSLSPWIGKDKKVPEEEIKGEFETRKITKRKIEVNSICVRISSLRCHSEAIILKINKNLKKKEFIKKIYKFKKFIKIVKNNKKSTLKILNPIYIMKKKNIYLGRIKKINKFTFSLFIIGDQLLWGATEPLIRFLKIFNEFKNLRTKKIYK
ncbi:aspartate-semialdehyde dehydrogenase [Candidatus Vidania fulgoroideorum]